MFLPVLHTSAIVGNGRPHQRHAQVAFREWAIVRKPECMAKFVNRAFEGQFCQKWIR